MELAFNLRKPLYEILSHMTYDEWVMWGLYLEQRPIGWREDQRTYLFLKTQGVKMSGEAIFDSLAKIKNHQKKHINTAVPHAGSFLHSMMMNATGGDKPEFLKEL